MAGGTFTFFFNVLVGDVTGGGVMNGLDISAIRSNLTSPLNSLFEPGDSNYRLDITGSNGLNSADVSQARAQLTSAFGTSLALLPAVTAPAETAARATMSFAALADESEETGGGTLSSGLAGDIWARYGIEDTLRNDAKKR